jgi:predicted ATPase
VSEWYKANFDGWGIKVNTDLQPFCKVELTREDRKFNVNIADVGQGMSQALPLVVNAFLPSNKYLTIIEQPELHLHPAAHGNLAQLFAESSIKFKKKYLIETHSQNFVLRLRRMIAEGNFDHNDLQIYWIDYDGNTNASCIKKINVNEFGEVDFWPENIFSETLDETIAMRTAQVKRKNGN